MQLWTEMASKTKRNLKHEHGRWEQIKERSELLKQKWRPHSGQKHERSSLHSDVDVASDWSKSHMTFIHGHTRVCVTQVSGDTPAVV